MDRGPERGADLDAEQVHPVQREPQPADAKEGIALLGQFQGRKLLIPADVHGAQHHRLGPKGGEHFLIGLELLLLTGQTIAAQVKKFRPEETAPICVGRAGELTVIDRRHVEADFQPDAVRVTGSVLK